MVEYLNVLKKYVNENTLCDHGYTYYSGKQKMCTWVYEEIKGTMKTSFPDTKQINPPQNTFYAKNVHIYKNIEMKVMRILIPHQITNLPFHHHIFMNNLKSMWKLLKKG